MSGEMSRHDVTEENWPLHFAIAREFGGTVEPFDVYQGPYILLKDGTRLFIGTEDGAGFYVWNESTRESSREFPGYAGDTLFTELAVEAAREVV